MKQMNPLAQYYPHIKHLHLLFILISVSLYNGRFWHRIRQPENQFPLLLRVLPMINDTLLLTSGITMIYIAKWSPFGSAAWLGWKLLFLLVYIFLGVLSMLQGARRWRAYAFYGAAMLMILLIIGLARCKNLCLFN